MCDDDTSEAAVTNNFNIREYYIERTRQLLARDHLSQGMLSHGTLLGDISEKIARDFIRQVLPPHYGVETGQIAAPNGAISPQSDVIIFNNVFGAILGASEDGTHLIHQDAVKCVIEVKRTATATQVVNINNHFIKLFTAFNAGKRKAPWYSHAIVFHSPQKTLDAIQEELNNIPVNDLRVESVLVLDAKHDADTLKKSFDGVCPKKAKCKPTGIAVQGMVDGLAAPNSALFVFKDQTSGFIRQRQNEQPLLTFVVRLHEQLRKYSGKPHHRLDDFRTQEDKKDGQPSV